VGHGFEGAGSREVLLKPVDLNFQLAGTGGAAEAAEFALLFGPLTRILPDLPPEQHQAVRAALVEASRRWTGILPQRSIMQRRSFPLVRSCKRYGKPARLGRSCSRPAPHSRGSRFSPVTANLFPVQPNKFPFRPRTGIGSQPLDSACRFRG
jgi:hypothetical protein